MWEKDLGDKDQDEKSKDFICEFCWKLVFYMKLLILLLNAC